MKDLRCADIQFYFKVLDNNIYEDKTIDEPSYICFSIKKAKKNFEVLSSPEVFYEKALETRKKIAKFIGADESKIIPVSFEEYDENSKEKK